MKMIRLLAAALVAGVAFSSNAQAFTVTPITAILHNYSGVSISTATTTLPVVDATDGLVSYNFSEAGSLAAKTAITYSYTATNVSPELYSHFENGAYGITNTLLSLSTPGTSATSGTALLPVYLTANFLPSTNPTHGFGTLTGTISIKNVTDVSQTFAAYFQSFLSQQRGLISVTAEIASIPLPPAFLMFLAGLVSIVGFSMYRKASERI